MNTTITMDPNVPYPVANIIISSYAHPIIFAIALASIFWGCMCIIVVSFSSFRSYRLVLD